MGHVPLDQERSMSVVAVCPPFQRARHLEWPNDPTCRTVRRHPRHVLGQPTASGGYISGRGVPPQGTGTLAGMNSCKSKHRGSTRALSPVLLNRPYSRLGYIRVGHAVEHDSSQDVLSNSQLFEVPVRVGRTGDSRDSLSHKDDLARQRRHTLPEQMVVQTAAQPARAGAPTLSATSRSKWKKRVIESMAQDPDTSP